MRGMKQGGMQHHGPPRGWEDGHMMNNHGGHNNNQWGAQNKANYHQQKPKPGMHGKYGPGQSHGKHSMFGGFGTKKKHGADDWMQGHKYGEHKRRQDMGPLEELTDAFTDIFSWDGKGTKCGSKNLIDQLASCASQAIWNPDVTPMGKLCQDIPQSTRDDTVTLISKVIKGELPEDPDCNFTMVFEPKVKDLPLIQNLAVLPLSKESLNEVLDSVEAAIDSTFENLTSSGIELDANHSLPAIITSVIKKMTDSRRQKIATAWRSFQGKLRERTRNCKGDGKVGDPPTKEEFCFYMRAREYSNKLKCALKQEIKKSEEDFGTKSFKKLLEYEKSVGAGPEESCSMGGLRRMEHPTVWKNEQGMISKGTFCSFSGQWMWETVAMCGCKDCFTVADGDNYYNDHGYSGQGDHGYDGQNGQNHLHNKKPSIQQLLLLLQNSNITKLLDEDFMTKLMSFNMTQEEVMKHMKKIKDKLAEAGIDLTGGSHGGSSGWGGPSGSMGHGNGSRPGGYGGGSSGWGGPSGSGGRGDGSSGRGGPSGSGGRGGGSSGRGGPSWSGGRGGEPGSGGRGGGSYDTRGRGQRSYEPSDYGNGWYDHSSFNKGSHDKGSYKDKSYSYGYGDRSSYRHSYGDDGLYASGYGDRSSYRHNYGDDGLYASGYGEGSSSHGYGDRSSYRHSYGDDGLYASSYGGGSSYRHSYGDDGLYASGYGEGSSSHGYGDDGLYASGYGEGSSSHGYEDRSSYRHSYGDDGLYASSYGGGSSYRHSYGDDGLYASGYGEGSSSHGYGDRSSYRHSYGDDGLHASSGDRSDRMTADRALEMMKDLSATDMEKMDGDVIRRMMSGDATEDDIKDVMAVYHDAMGKGSEDSDQGKTGRQLDGDRSSDDRNSYGDDGLHASSSE